VMVWFVCSQKSNKGQEACQANF